MSAAVIVNGAAGRMGRLVATALRRAGVASVAGRVRGGAAGSLPLEDGPLPLVADLVADLAPAGVVVDFSQPGSVPDLARAARERGARLVVGTTGYDPGQMDTLREISGRVAVVYARNFSLGLNRLLQLVPGLAVFLQDGFDCECLEVHHRGKRDAPSGTALALVEALAPEAPRVHGRHGANAARQPGEIGVHSLRLGAVVGEHALVFGSEHEVVEVRHRALDRAAFVTGVVPAVRFAARQPPGWYTMLDVMRDAVPRV